MTEDGDVVTEGWITFDRAGVEVAASSTQNINFTPTSTEIRTKIYKIGVTYYTTHGADLTYQAFEITIECVVASFTAPPDPASIAYTIFDEMKVLDMANNPYVQIPACDYPYTGVFTWSNVPGNLSPPEPYINEDSVDNGKINILSFNPDHAGTVNISIASVVLSIADNNGSAFSYTESTQVDATIVLTNPCLTTFINVIDDLGSSSLTVTDGDTTETTFSEPDVEVDALKSTPGLCGPTLFEVYSNSNDTPFAQPWAVIEDLGGLNRKIFFNTTVDLSLIANEASYTVTVQIKTYLQDYPTIKHYTPVAVTINAAACDCTYLLWTDTPYPSALSQTVMVGTPGTITLPRPSPDSITNRYIHPSFQKCYEASTPCAETGRYNLSSDILLDGSALPGWITFNPDGYDTYYTGSTTSITVNPAAA